ncbi:UDP-2,3-diacylglucosamine pyrophosphatase LpxH [Salinibacter ruber]|uniref:hypothetical protein n=1 Tax=Salinibacter ruber TaxID=146919 RepID=UPI002168E322|nr:hypothetical protein [Salinibacter ruber]MCS3827454.1 UDP-2,3-diacylglucosamine pyrophosphatase LpxH [Salinibacter ruber]
MDGQHPFDLPDDFPFAELGQDYATGNFSIQEIATRYDISRDTFLAIRRAAPQTWTQEPPNLWWEDLDKGADEIAQEAADRAKAADATRRAKRRKSREDEKAARKWHRFEEAAEEALEGFRSEDYEPPRLNVTVAQSPAEKACAVANLQDLHLGVRPADAEDFSVETYREEILSRFRTALEDAARLRQLEQLFVVGGADLVHSDTKGGQTASGTELEMACSTATALQHGIQLLVEIVDLARQIVGDVVIVPVHGNHDRTNGVAAAMAAGQRFHSASDVSSMDLSERQYATYADHLLCLTHGDYAKKTMRKMGEIMRSEARGLYGRTEWSSVFVGHLHHKAMDMVDESGRMIYQTPSPVPIDSYHDQEGYVGSRKGIQLVLLDRESGGDRIIHA